MRDGASLSGGSLDERMTLMQIIGGVIILSAVFIVQLEKEDSGSHFVRRSRKAAA